MATAAGDELEKILLFVDNTPLDPDYTLFDVKTALIPVVAEWRAIGEGLRLRGGTLNVINKNHPNDAKSCMGAVAGEWLKRNYRTDMFGDPTWRKLVEIIGSPMGGNNLNHARKIAQQHPGSKPPSLIRSDTISKEVAALREQLQEQSDSSSKEVAALRDQLQEQGRKMAKSQREKQQLVEAVEKMDKLEQQLRTLKSSIASDSNSKEIAVLQQQLWEQGRKMEELASSQRDKQRQMEVVQKVAELELELKKLRPPIQSESQKMPAAAPRPPPQRPGPLQPMQPKPQRSTGEQKAAMSNKQEKEKPQTRLQEQKPHPPPVQKSWWQFLFGPKMELKQGEHQPPPLPARFSQLNGRAAFLRNISISDGEATALAENVQVNKTLETLCFNNVTFSTIGLATVLAALRENKSVKDLRLIDTTLSDSNSEVLAQVLRINTTIDSLHLYETNISGSGANALATAIQVNKTLQDLRVSFKSVSDGGARDFAKKMERWGSSLKTLEIWDATNISEEVKKILRETARRKGIKVTFF